jgi:hypothetical protein
LAECDILRSVETISCVSGGSIIGAHYYLLMQELLESKRDEEITKQDLIDLVAKLIKQFRQGVERYYHRLFSNHFLRTT